MIKILPPADARGPQTKCSQEINMDTNKRAAALSKAIGIEAETLLELVAKELGHRDSL